MMTATNFALMVLFLLVSLTVIVITVTKIHCWIKSMSVAEAASTRQKEREYYEHFVPDYGKKLKE